MEFALTLFFFVAPPPKQRLWLSTPSPTALSRCAAGARRACFTALVEAERAPYPDLELIDHLHDRIAELRDSGDLVGLPAVHR